MHARAVGGKGGGNENMAQTPLRPRQFLAAERVVSDAYESNRLALIISLA